METGISQSYEVKGSKGGITVKVTVTEEYDILENRSQVAVAVSVKSSTYYNHTYYLTGKVKIEDTTLVSMNATIPTHYVTPGSLDSYYRIRAQSDRYSGSPWVQEILHNTDGSKSIRVEISLRGYTTSGGGGSGWSVADSRTLELTHIPRANAIGASDAYIGAVSTVSVVRRSMDYTHSVAYSFGDLAGFLNADGSLRDAEILLTQSSIPFAIPETFYQQIPAQPSGICTLTCRTYKEGIQVGEPQSTTFTVTANQALCAPGVTGTVTDGNPVTVMLTGDSSKLVRFASRAVCSISAEAKNGATIKTKTIAGKTVEESMTLEGVEQSSIPVAATDSRGYTTTAVLEVPMIPYTRLTAMVTAQRTNPTNGKALLTVTGNCYRGSFGAVENTLQIRCCVDGGAELEFTPVWEEDTYSLQAELTGLDYLRNHTLVVAVSDRVQTITKTVGVGKGIPVFHWGENDFAFQVPVSLEGCRLRNIADPEASTDSASKGYTDTLAARTLATAREASTANWQVERLSAESFDEEQTFTVPGGWTAGYRLYMILLAMADTDTPMVQLLIPRQEVAEESGPIWSACTANSAKKLQIYYRGDDLVVAAVGHTGNGGSLACIYGLFPEQTEEEV